MEVHLQGKDALQCVLRTPEGIQTGLPENKENDLFASCRMIYERRLQLFATVQAEALGRDDINLSKVHLQLLFRIFPTFFHNLQVQACP